MSRFSRRLAAFCCTSLTAYAALLSADNADYDYSDQYYNEPGNCYEETCCDPCDSHWSFGAEFLYWKTHADCLNVSRVVSRDITTSSHHHFIEKEHLRSRVKTPNFKWRPGFRFDVGYKNPDCCWDFNSSWTSLYSRAEGSQKAGDNRCVEPWFASGLSVPFSSHHYKVDVQNSHAKGKFGFNYNALEFGLGHTYDACGCFELRPHVDLKFAWLNQRYTNSFHRDVAVSSKEHHNKGEGWIHERVNAKSKLTAIGPQFGFDIKWDMGCNWNLFAKATGAVLYANPRNHWKSSLFTGGFEHQDWNLHDSRGSKNRNHNNKLIYNTGIAAGFGWSTNLCEDSYLLSLKLGWEHHLYFGVVDLDPENCDDGKLSMYGLTMAVGLDY